MEKMQKKKYFHHLRLLEDGQHKE